jgi:hypothetical protein
MNLRTIATRIVKGEFHVVFGRFKTVRTCYSGFRRLRDWLREQPAGDVRQQPTLFPATDVDQAVRAIKDEAVFVGLRLPRHIVDEIEAFSRSEPLHPGNDPEAPTFNYAGVVRGQTDDGRAMVISGVRDPVRCAAVKEVVNDPVLRAIVRKYLGYEPRRVMTLLKWSFASDFTDEEHRRLKNGVIDYHYDIMGFNFVYASFYILDTDRRSGAHVMMKRSHNRKPLRMLLGSTVASEDAVRHQFGVENEVTIEGPAGLGFVQDTSCYHRATRPIDRDRLMPAIRFS